MQIREELTLDTLVSGLVFRSAVSEDQGIEEVAIPMLDLAIP